MSKVLNVLKVAKAKRLIMDLILKEFPGMNIKIEESIWNYTHCDGSTIEFSLYASGSRPSIIGNNSETLWIALISFIKKSDKENLLDDPRVKAIGELSV